MQEETSACAHTNCKCQVAKEGEFCGEDCLEARDVTEIGCGCEHQRWVDQL